MTASVCRRAAGAGRAAYLIAVAALFVLGALAPAAQAANQGALLWSAVVAGSGTGYESLSSVVADGAGNGYFGGTVSTPGNGLDAVVTRLSTAGARVWTYTWDGPAHLDDGSWMDAAIDRKAGRVYVAFTTTGADGHEALAVLCLTTGGKAQWTHTWTPPAGLEADWPVVAVDTSGNVGVGTGSYDAAAGGWITKQAVLLKYSPAGKLLWTRTWAPAGGGYSIADIAAAPGGRLCLTGTTYAGEEPRDIATLMYTASGKQAWVKTWNNPAADPGSRSNYGFAVASLAGGAVAVAGHTDGEGPTNNRDAVVLKYTAAGLLSWARVRDEGRRGTEVPLSLVADSAGNLYAGGWGIGADASEDGYLLSYTSAGKRRWTSWFADPAGFDQEIESIAVAGTRVYFCGQRYDAPGDAQCVAGAVSTATGGRRWVGVFDGGAAYQETWPAALAVVPGASVFVAAGGASGEAGDGVALRFAP